MAMVPSGVLSTRGFLTPSLSPNVCLHLYLGLKLWIDISTYFRKSSPWDTTTSGSPALANTGQAAESARPVATGEQLEKWQIQWFNSSGMV